MHNEWKRKIEKEITEIFDTGLNAQNLEMAGELIDMWKDIHQVCYWDEKEDLMKMEIGAIEMAAHEKKMENNSHEMARMSDHMDSKKK